MVNICKFNKQCSYCSKECYDPLSNTEILRLYNEEKRTCRQIALIDGRSDAHIYKILKSIGVQFRTKSEANKIFSDQIVINLYNIGLSARQVGRLLGVHPTSVTKRLYKLNFPLRSKNLAQKIKYTESEFQKYFMNQEFVNKIKQG